MVPMAKYSEVFYKIGICSSPTPGFLFPYMSGFIDTVAVLPYDCPGASEVILNNMCELYITSLLAFASNHSNDVIMGAITSQITSLTIVYSTVYSGTYQRKYKSCASLAFVRGIHRGPVNSPHKWLVTREMFPFDDVIIMISYYASSNRFTVSNHWRPCLIKSVMRIRIFDIKMPISAVRDFFHPAYTWFNRIWHGMGVRCGWREELFMGLCPDKVLWRFAILSGKLQLQKNISSLP